MKRVGIVYLITEKPEARGVLDAPTETRRKTYCVEKSLTMSEVYQARADGYAPTIRLELPQDFEYRGETLCEYKGERYRIIRDYRDEKTGDSTELTLERVRGNAAKQEEQPAGPTGPTTGEQEEPADPVEEPVTVEPAGTQETGEQTEPVETEENGGDL